MGYTSSKDQHLVEEIDYPCQVFQLCVTTFRNHVTKTPRLHELLGLFYLTSRNDLERSWGMFANSKNKEW